ncbi:hypothetical protein ALI144C_52280 [Actinosynnema sp. ALI-1.44]|nr:hypothetical protein ALI144C_52280 [Actinosynnema sp. ALI-1.44]
MYARVESPSGARRAVAVALTFSTTAKVEAVANCDTVDPAFSTYYRIATKTPQNYVMPARSLLQMIII